MWMNEVKIAWDYVELSSVTSSCDNPSSTITLGVIIGFLRSCYFVCNVPRHTIANIATRVGGRSNRTHIKRTKDWRGSLMDPFIKSNHSFYLITHQNGTWYSRAKKVLMYYLNSIVLRYKRLQCRLSKPRLVNKYLVSRFVERWLSC